MFKGFEKAIEQLIVDRYPLIKSFYIYVTPTVTSLSGVGIVYELKDDMDEKVLSNIRELTETLFRMTGPYEKHYFRKVRFEYTEE